MMSNRSYSNEDSKITITNVATDCVINILLFEPNVRHLLTSGLLFTCHQYFEQFIDKDSKKNEFWRLLHERDIGNCIRSMNHELCFCKILSYYSNFVFQHDPRYMTSMRKLQYYVNVTLDPGNEDLSTTIQNGHILDTLMDEMKLSLNSCSLKSAVWNQIGDMEDYIREEISRSSIDDNYNCLCDYLFNWISQMLKKPSSFYVIGSGSYSERNCFGSLNITKLTGSIVFGSANPIPAILNIVLICDEDTDYDYGSGMGFSGYIQFKIFSETVQYKMLEFTDISFTRVNGHVINTFFNHVTGVTNQVSIPNKHAVRGIEMDNVSQDCKRFYAS
jgi:hypothetical protein